MAIPFSYTNFWKWFRDDPEHVLAPATDVFATVYSIDYSAVKYSQTSSSPIPFLTRNMRAMRVADGDALTTHFPGGLFAGMESAAFGDGDEKARTKALRKKNLFIVFPKVVQHEGVPIVIADHYSLRVARKARQTAFGGCGRTTLRVVKHASGVRQAAYLRQAAVVDDGGNRKTPLHFHITEYFPAPGSYGAVLVEKNYMPLNFTLPPVVAFKAMLVSERLRTQYATAMHSVFSRPWAEAAMQTGGGQAARRRVRQRAVGAPDASFEDLWRTLPLSRITVFGIAARSGYDVTVFLTDRLRHISGNRRGYAFHVDRPATIPATIARLMGGLSWSDFADPDDV